MENKVAKKLCELIFSEVVTWMKFGSYPPKKSVTLRRKLFSSLDSQLASSPI